MRSQYSQGPPSFAITSVEQPSVLQGNQFSLIDGIVR
jgi:hypothetical protein